MLSQQEQLEYELEHDSAAAAARLSELRKQADEGKMDLPRTKRLMAAAFSDVKLSLEAVQQTKARGVGGTYRSWIKALPADLLAALVLRTVIQTVQNVPGGRACTIQILASAVGRAIEMERRIYEAERVNPLYMQRVHERIERSGSQKRRYVHSLYRRAYKAVMKEGAEGALTNSEVMHIGKFGVQACMDAGVIDVERSLSTSGTLVLYKLTPEVHAAMHDYTDADVHMVVDQSSSAMLRPPLDWPGLAGGGYYSARRQMQRPLMRMNKLRRSEWTRIRDEFTPEKMPQVFDCANYLQSIPLQIHEPTLRAIQRVWTTGGGVLGVPEKGAPKVPKFPLGDSWDKASATTEELRVFNEWRDKARQAHESLSQWKTRTREISAFLRHSRQLPDGHPMWFPVFMDTRGRWYYRGSPNPQGTDIAKAVLHLHEKRPLGRRGLFWLRVAIANNYGYDKVRFKERAAWTEQNWELIESALDAPEDHPDVWGGDAPWCMFTAAWELREALRSPNPELYRTGVPVHMDATCSGIQHLSAMLRDPVGGKFVNLVDDELVGPKQDVYGKVASAAYKALENDLNSPDANVRLMAQFWYKRGIERALAKKPVMTYVYGATLRGTAQYVLSYVTDNGEEFPDDEVISKYTLGLYLAKRLFNGIERTVPASAFLMNWFKQVARDAPHGKRIEWRTPTGFLAQHDYQNFNEVRIKLRSCGVTDVYVREYTDGVRALPMQNAISPNFVHSMDASHLTKTALLMQSKGMQMLSIHDSFGTHPSDVDAMHECIREAFVDLYSDESLLAQFMLDAGVVGEAPMLGNLDLNRVLSSEFFFC